MITYIAEIICIPLLIAGVAIFSYAYRKQPGRERRSWLTAGVVFCMIGCAIPLASPSESVRMVANFQVVCIFMGGAMVVLALLARAPMIKEKGSLAGWTFSLLMSIFSVAFLLWGAFGFYGDFLLPREFVVGNVTRSSQTGGYGKRFPPQYKLRLNGRDYPTTADVFDNAPSWNNVRAEIGAGSGTIFQITPLVTQLSPSAPPEIVWPSPDTVRVPPASFENERH